MNDRSTIYQDAEKVRQRRSRIAQRLTVRPEYDSPLRSLRPCWTAFLRILRAIQIPTGRLRCSRRIVQKSSFSTACYTKEPAWTDIDRAALRTEDHKVLALLVLYTALILSGIWGIKVLERHIEGQQEPVSAGEIM